MRSEDYDIERTWHRTERNYLICRRKRSTQTTFSGYGIDTGRRSDSRKICAYGRSDRVEIHGYELTIRLDDAEKIEVKEIKSEEKEKERRNKVKRSAHPGYGEGGKYHKKETENPLKDDETLTFALVGNQNCGKTTLFNQLTGLRSMSEIFRALP